MTYIQKLFNYLRVNFTLRITLIITLKVFYYQLDINSIQY